MNDESWTDFPPQLCEHLMAALLQPDATEHDISLSVNHALECRKCVRAIEDFIHERAYGK